MWTPVPDWSEKGEGGLYLTPPILVRVEYSGYLMPGEWRNLRVCGELAEVYLFPALMTWAANDA